MDGSALCKKTVSLSFTVKCYIPEELHSSLNPTSFLAEEETEAGGQKRLTQAHPDPWGGGVTHPTGVWKKELALVPS